MSFKSMLVGAASFNVKENVLSKLYQPWNYIFIRRQFTFIAISKVEGRLKPMQIENVCAKAFIRLHGI